MKDLIDYDNFFWVSFQFTGSNGVLDSFLVFLILFNYVIPISLYVTVGECLL